MHLLQVANVGEICGGTAACAWSVTRALPLFRHTVLFLSPPTSETLRAFSHCTLLCQSQVTEKLVNSIGPDLCLLHNTAPGQFPEPVPVPTISYHHSRGRRVQGSVDVACSQWLANQLQPELPVLYQGVPVPVKGDCLEARSLRERLVVGRICTPTPRKWPVQLVAFYEVLANKNPHVDWEFVGCPQGLMEPLRRACQGRIRFHSAGWQARRHFWRWDVLLYHHPRLQETFGRTVAEAMRAGCIPIVDRAGGFQEQVSPESGFLCTNSGEFEAALQIVSETPARRRFSAQARWEADHRFSLAAFSSRLLETFERIWSLQ